MGDIMTDRYNTLNKYLETIRDIRTDLTNDLQVIAMEDIDYYEKMINSLDILFKHYQYERNNIKERGE